MKKLKITSFIHNICHMYYYFLLYVMLKSQKIDLYFKIYEYVSCRCRTGVGHWHVSDTATRPQNEVSMLLRLEAMSRLKTWSFSQENKNSQSQSERKQINNIRKTKEQINLRSMDTSFWRRVVVSDTCQCSIFVRHRHDTYV